MRSRHQACPAPARLAEMLRGAVDMCAESSGRWDTLGATPSLVKNGKRAIEVLTRSTPLQGENAHDELLLAMVHRRHGDNPQPRSW